MKKLFFLLFLTFATHVAIAQTNVESLMSEMPDMGDNIYLTAVIPDESAYPKEVLRLCSSDSALPFRPVFHNHMYI